MVWQKWEKEFPANGQHSDQISETDRDMGKTNGDGDTPKVHTPTATDWDPLTKPVQKKYSVEKKGAILELLEKTMYNYRGLEPLLEKADFEDELLTSEVFNTDYRFHRITLETNFEGNEQVINNLMLFLNNNKKFNEIKEVVIKDTNFKLGELDKTIVYINHILENYSVKDTDNQDPNKIFISTGSTVTDLGILVEKKNSSLKQQEELKTELIKYNTVVTVLNNPALYKKPTFISINTKSLAFIFVFTYFTMSC